MQLQSVKQVCENKRLSSHNIVTRVHLSIIGHPYLERN